jgi:hypothetical protein
MLPVEGRRTLFVYRVSPCRPPSQRYSPEEHEQTGTGSRGLADKRETRLLSIAFRSGRGRAKGGWGATLAPPGSVSRRAGPRVEDGPDSRHAGSPTQRAASEPAVSRAVGESWNQPGASHRMRVRSHRLPRRVLIGNQAAAHRDGATAAAPRRAAGTATASVSVRVSDWADAAARSRRSSSAQARALPASWPRTPDSTNGDPITCGGCTRLALPTSKKNQVGRSGRTA